MYRQKILGSSNSHGRMYDTRYLDDMHTIWDIGMWLRRVVLRKADQFLLKRQQPEAIFLFGILLIRGPYLKIIENISVENIRCKHRQNMQNQIFELCL